MYSIIRAFQRAIARSCSPVLGDVAGTFSTCSTFRPTHFMASWRELPTTRALPGASAGVKRMGRSRGRGRGSRSGRALGLAEGGLLEGRLEQEEIPEAFPSRRHVHAPGFVQHTPCQRCRRRRAPRYRSGPQLRGQSPATLRRSHSKRHGRPHQSPVCRTHRGARRHPLSVQRLRLQSPKSRSLMQHILAVVPTAQSKES